MPCMHLVVAQWHYMSPWDINIKIWDFVSPHCRLTLSYPSLTTSPVRTPRCWRRGTNCWEPSSLIWAQRIPPRYAMGLRLNPHVVIWPPSLHASVLLRYYYYTSVLAHITVTWLLPLLQSKYDTSMTFDEAIRLVQLLMCSQLHNMCPKTHCYALYISNNLTESVIWCKWHPVFRSMSELGRADWGQSSWERSGHYNVPFEWPFDSRHPIHDRLLLLCLGPESCYNLINGLRLVGWILQMDCSFSRLQEERERQAQLRGPPKIDPVVAATSIQKVDKGSVLTFNTYGSTCV